MSRYILVWDVDICITSTINWDCVFPTLPREMLRLLDGGEVRALADLGWLSLLGFPKGLPARLVLPKIGLLVMMKEAVIEGDVGDKIDNNNHTNCDDENLDRSPGDVATEKNVSLELNNSGPLVKKELEECKQVFLKSEAGVERPCADVFVKEEVTDTIDDQIKTSVDDDTADGVIGDPNNHGYQESSPKKYTNHEEIKKQSPGNAPLLSLPKFLADKTTTGTLDQQLSAQFAIISLDFPAGTKALLHCDRLWLADQAMSVWEGLTEQVVRVNARRVEGFEEFDYQVTFAHFDNGVGQNEEGGLVKFSEDKLEAHTLDKELEMFKKN